MDFAKSESTDCNCDAKLAAAISAGARTLIGNATKTTRPATGRQIRDATQILAPCGRFSAHHRPISHRRSC